MKGFILLALSFLAFGEACAVSENFCESIPNSKRYITNNFSEPYPKVVIFKCDYRCNSNGSIEIINAQSNVRVGSMRDDAVRVVCQGVKVKQTSWGYDFDKNVPFYAHNTKLSELKNWANNNIERNNAEEVRLLMEFKERVAPVIAAYAQAGSTSSSFAYFMEAANMLIKATKDLPADPSKLDALIKTVKQANGNYSTTSALGLVAAQITTQAFWRY